MRKFPETQVRTLARPSKKNFFHAPKDWIFCHTAKLWDISGPVLLLSVMQSHYFTILPRGSSLRWEIVNRCQYSGLRVPVSTYSVAAVRWRRIGAATTSVHVTAKCSRVRSLCFEIHRQLPILESDSGLSHTILNILRRIQHLKPKCVRRALLGQQ
jgi:hypothetical protein